MAIVLNYLEQKHLVSEHERYNWKCVGNWWRGSECKPEDCIYNSDITKQLWILSSWVKWWKQYWRRGIQHLWGEKIEAGKPARRFFTVIEAYGASDLLCVGAVEREPVCLFIPCLIAMKILGSLQESMKYSKVIETSGRRKKQTRPMHSWGGSHLIHLQWNLIRKKKSHPGQGGSVGHHPISGKIANLILGQGTCSSCGLDPWFWVCLSMLHSLCLLSSP